jgi:predicted RNA-binding protein
MIRPGQKVSFSVIADMKSNPEMVVTTTPYKTGTEDAKSLKEDTKEYNLTSSKAKSVKDRFLQSYEKLCAMIFGSSNSPLSWEDIKTSYDKEVSGLVENEDNRIAGGTIMSVVAQQNLKESQQLQGVKELLTAQSPHKSVKASKAITSKGDRNLPTIR